MSSDMDLAQRSPTTTGYFFAYAFASVLPELRLSFASAPPLFFARPEPVRSNPLDSTGRSPLPRCFLVPGPFPPPFPPPFPDLINNALSGITHWSVRETEAPIPRQASADGATAIRFSSRASDFRVNADNRSGLPAPPASTPALAAARSAASAR